MVEFYQTPRGDYPAKDFLESLQERPRMKAAAWIGLLQEKGPKSSTTLCRRFGRTNSRTADLLWTLRNTATLFHPWKKHCPYSRIYEKDTKSPKRRNRFGQTIPE